MIDWQRIFDGYGIDYVVGPAPNVRRGRLGINCPRCDGDTKHHFSVDTENGRVVGCWRDSSHWMPPAELLSTLAGLSYRDAKKLLEQDDAPMPTGESVKSMLARMEQPATEHEQPAVELLPEFKRFKDRPGAEVRFRDYMRKRGFADPTAVAKRFKLRWCSRGTFAGRVIFPIYQDGTLRGWSGRAIGTSRAKYKAHPPGDAMASLLWESRSEGGKPLIICEGPFDALKIAVAGDVVAAALLTNRAGPAKLARLVRLASRATSVTVLLDRGAEGQALDLRASLAVIAPKLAFVPEPYKDPGDVPVRELHSFLKKVTR